MAPISYLASALVLLAIVASSTAQRKSEICRDSDCPLFVSSDRGTYELRTMSNPTHWVVTDMDMSGPSMGWRDSSTMFRKLFNYISGTNAANMRMDMTVPVLTKVETKPDGGYKMTMMFYISGTATPPNPTDSTVNIVTFPQGAQFFVRTFRKYWWASSSDYEDNLADLVRDIADPALYDNSASYRAGYESPMFFGRRRYEVWLQAL